MISCNKYTTRLCISLVAADTTNAVWMTECQQYTTALVNMRCTKLTITTRIRRHWNAGLCSNCRRFIQQYTGAACERPEGLGLTKLALLFWSNTLLFRWTVLSMNKYYDMNKMLKAIATQHAAIHGLLRSPIRAHFQNTPSKPCLLRSIIDGNNDLK